MRHLYTDGTDTVIAESESDADIVWSNEMGEDHDECTETPWVMIPDDKPFPIFFEDELKEDRLPINALVEYETKEDPMPGSFVVRITAAAKDWANCRGGFLCSIEY